MNPWSLGPPFGWSRTHDLAGTRDKAAVPAGDAVRGREGPALALLRGRCGPSTSDRLAESVDDVDDAADVPHPVFDSTASRSASVTTPATSRPIFSTGMPLIRCSAWQTQDLWPLAAGFPGRLHKKWRERPEETRSSGSGRRDGTAHRAIRIRERRRRASPARGVSARAPSRCPRTGTRRRRCRSPCSSRSRSRTGPVLEGPRAQRLSAVQPGVDGPSRFLPVAARLDVTRQTGPLALMAARSLAHAGKLDRW